MFVSSGEPAARPAEISCDAPGSSRTEFVVERIKSGEKGFGVTTCSHGSFIEFVALSCLYWQKKVRLSSVVFLFFANPADAILGFGREQKTTKTSCDYAAFCATIGFAAKFG